MTQKKTEIWPYAIIGSFLAFGAFIFSMVYLMTSAKVDLVSPTYYKEEIAFQDQIDKHNRAVIEGREMKYLLTDQELKISFPGASAATNGTLKFARLTDAKDDKEFAIRVNESGDVILPLAQFQKGMWLVKADWTDSGKAYFDEEKIFIP